jgi:DMSO/TMAO reductase YedYZ molybdopterin-dependent catalytic subunit
MTERIDARTHDRDRLPPGQIVTQKWPVLHYGTVPRVDTTRWTLEVSGAVDHPFTLKWDEIAALPRQETVCDIHCVTRWSRYDNVFDGIPLRPLLERAGVHADARFVLVHAEQGFSTNVPIDDFTREANLLALKHNGQDLDPEHGGPIRLLIPHLYFWKSAKWVRGFEFLTEDYPGFWEQNGYHMRGEPWAEERYGRPDPVRMRRGPRK